MFHKLDALEETFRRLNKEIEDPEVYSNQKVYQEKIKQIAEIRDIVESYDEYRKVKTAFEEAKSIIAEGEDEEFVELAKEELPPLEEKLEELTEHLKLALLPKDPLDGKSVVLEIRAGTGGDEASLFAGDLYRMYCRFAEKCHWKVEVLSSNEIGIGGYKEIIAEINGKDVYSRMKYESGTHRVQRVPETETQGRIHTSAATVVVMPKPEAIDVQIDPNDLRIDVFRSSGNGGQSVNTTDSAVRITHIPSGLVVSMQDEKSQHKNRAKAMEVLRVRLFDIAQREQQSELSETRKAMVGTGDRSQRIRTYNFPQGRVTDHRIGLTLYRLDAIMNGDIDELITKIRIHYQAEALKASSSAA